MTKYNAYIHLRKEYINISNLLRKYEKILILILKNFLEKKRKK